MSLSDFLYRTKAAAELADPETGMTYFDACQVFDTSGPASMTLPDPANAVGALTVANGRRTDVGSTLAVDSGDPRARMWLEPGESTVFDSVEVLVDDGQYERVWIEVPHAP